MKNNEYTKIPKYKNGKYTDEELKERKNKRNKIYYQKNQQRLRELNKNNYYKRITNNSID